MSLQDFTPTLTPQSWQQLGVNTIYAAAAGAFIARQIDVPGEYGALGLGGAYALIGFSNSPSIITKSVCHSVEGALGGKDSVGDILGNPCHAGVAGWVADKVSYLPDAVRIEEMQWEAWWNREVLGKKTGNWTPVNSTPECTVQKLLQDPKSYFQHCHKQ